MSEVKADATELYDGPTEILDDQNTQVETIKPTGTSPQEDPREVSPSPEPGQTGDSRKRTAETPADGERKRKKVAEGHEKENRPGAVAKRTRTSDERPTFSVVDNETNDEILDFYHQFPGLKDKYHLICKIGEGTFSSVYEAVDLEHDLCDNTAWSRQLTDRPKDDPYYVPLAKAFGNAPSVALKRIYVTSSSQRICNEIRVLSTLRGHPNIVHLITALRHQDQVVVVLPYFRHSDFRDFYLKLTMDEIRDYMRALLSGLEHIHKYRIIHRDVKPSNFLYNLKMRTGVLCDFGLAQREEMTAPKITSEGLSSVSPAPPKRSNRKPGYIINDPRPSVRASRAGTRGFRAPEVLMKVTHQTCAIDLWSVGVILLSIFTGHFPFFQSSEDQEAYLEIAHIFGKQAMQKLALQFRRHLETNIPSVDAPMPFETLCERLHSRRAKEIPPEGYDLLKRLLALHPEERITAAEACMHPFLAGGDGGRATE
ncbi:kinase-like domain-containing protein [Fimicolochytrium jonesii]|uniref:kinase-like domain-containing protein n=1 Tax=Fimicolochytrium jonesii TaxID=1396493 RepID=UPI0022FF2E9D|nr:kinase-like domain-containing protein [Fimicolochytrium jonesii]KAI8819660.1 kinase-like domain-containing protein [Fimicolochytrium jonesii]